jgi:L-fucose isomerase
MANLLSAKPKVALMTFGDERDYMWDGYFGPLTQPRHEEAIAYLRSLPIEVIAFDEVARSKPVIDEQVKALKAAGAESLFVHLPCWATPNLVVRAVQRMALPTVTMTSKSAATHGMVGLFGAAGTLSQIGIDHIRVRDDFGAPVFAERLLPYFRAASAKARLHGRVMGLFGGRSLGIDTGTFDPMQWRSQFGVDVDHIDQLEIVRRAELVDAERVEKNMAWMADQFASIAFDDQKLTQEKLELQVRCYLANKDINEEKGFDFISVKCMTELSDHYVPQCISAALMPGPYDGEGAKQPCSMSCEADGDGALTMEILKESRTVAACAHGLQGEPTKPPKTSGTSSCARRCVRVAAQSRILRLLQDRSRSRDSIGSPASIEWPLSREKSSSWTRATWQPLSRREANTSYQPHS